MGGLDAGGGLEDKNVRIATLRSRQFTEDFIRDKNLLPVLFPERWDSAANTWKARGGKSKQPSMGMAVRLFDKGIRKISEDRRTGLITLSIEWRDPKVAAQWCNELIARTNATLRSRAIDESQRSIAFLDEELGKTSVVERRQIIYNLIESKTREIVLANARKEYAFLTIDPAVASEPDFFVKPRRAIMIVVGMFLGLLIGVAYASVRWARAPKW